MYGSLYRHVLLPVFDRVVKGRRTLDYWKQAEAAQWEPREKLEARQFHALRNLVAHAYETCTYYRLAWEARGLSPDQLRTPEDFHDWPVMTRETIHEHRTEMRTSLPLELLSKATGGSSGVPLQFDLDTGSDQRRTAMMYRGYGWAGGAPGSRQLFVWGSHVGPLPTWKRWKAALHARIERHRIINCFDFTPARMHDHWRTLQRYRPDVIVAYTNPLYEFARYLKESGQRVYSPRSIIVGAEKIHDFQRKLIESVFQAPVFETYGSREFMLIGAECEQHRGLHLSIDNLLIEILDDDGQPTLPGQEGNVVITDLFNYGMPFIRYLNGDRAVAGFGNCLCGRGLPLLKRVVGRRLDVLDTPDGRKVPGEFFPHLIKDFPGIRRFQVEQNIASRITLRLVVDDTFTDGQKSLLTSEITARTGPAVELDLQFVEEIPLSQTGKHRVVVRNL